jgi:hypothetical protein
MKLDLAGIITNQSTLQHCLSRDAAGAITSVNTSQKITSATVLLMNFLQHMRFMEFLSVLVAGGSASNRFTAFFVYLFHPSLWRTKANCDAARAQTTQTESVVLKLLAKIDEGKAFLANAKNAATSRGKA